MNADLAPSRATGLRPFLFGAIGVAIGFVAARGQLVSDRLYDQVIGVETPVPAVEAEFFGNLFAFAGGALLAALLFLYALGAMLFGRTRPGVIVMFVGFLLAFGAVHIAAEFNLIPGL
ncbi:hypothetical protein V8J82_16810 [Gymnodinialimonas sp. 2305UL16-5]|uniref:hypothetical protein n=1 Tax=Gymnodinialimonas mytili TaxID=3126503 RepID=UPI0030B3D6AB